MRSEGGDLLGGDPSEPLVLVVGSDDRYAMPLAVTLYSALTRIPGEVSVSVNVFDAGISQGNRLRVERVVRDARLATELNWHVLDQNQLKGLRSVRWLTTAAYSRLLIPEILFEERAVIYLDSDLLIRRDLSALLREADGSRGSAVWAVDDFFHPDVGDVLGDQNCLDLGVDPRAPYFNSGVLVIDVQKWRDMQITERCLAFVREKAPIMRYHDQDALNVVFASQWQRLDPRWNVMLPSLRFFVARERSSGHEHERRVEQLTSGAFVFHFIGRHKPWQPSYQGPGQHEYLQAVRNAGWFERDRALMLWRAKLGAMTALWKVYRRLPERVRAKVRSVSRPRDVSPRTNSTP